jgi:hypothetical protein
MSTLALGVKPRPETRMRVVGGPVFLERVMDGAALATPQSSRQAEDRRARKLIE